MNSSTMQALDAGYAVDILEADTPWRFKSAELARYMLLHEMYCGFVRLLHVSRNNIITN